MHEFYEACPPAALGDPAADPPLAIRVHPEDDPSDPAARRVVKTDDPYGEDVWFQATGRVSPDFWKDHSDVRDWPVQHWLVAAAVFGHHVADAARQGSGQVVVGDMGVDAFKGGA